jgi:hypothetical protein
MHGYAQALVSEEIAAAYLEVPCIKVFLAKHCKGFTTSGPTYRVGGFGFVNIVSPLTSHCFNVFSIPQRFQYC